MQEGEYTEYIARCEVFSLTDTEIWFGIRRQDEARSCNPEVSDHPFHGSMADGRAQS